MLPDGAERFRADCFTNSIGALCYSWVNALDPNAGKSAGREGESRCDSGADVDGHRGPAPQTGPDIVNGTTQCRLPAAPARSIAPRVQEKGGDATISHGVPSEFLDLQRGANRAPGEAPERLGVPSAPGPLLPGRGARPHEVGGRHVDAAQVDDVLRLQGLVGNRAVARALQAINTGSPELRTTAANGPAEAQATAVACGADTTTTQQARRPAMISGPQLEPVRRAFGERMAIDVNTAPPPVAAVLRSAGHPLDQGVRSTFEGAFGQDLSRVRLHSDESAATAAAAVRARAFTVGRHIVFGRGQHAPHTPRGNDLIAHELAHVVQQSTEGPQARPVLQREPEDDEEARRAQRAREKGEKVLAGDVSKDVPPESTKSTAAKKGEPTRIKPDPSTARPTGASTASDVDILSQPGMRKQYKAYPRMPQHHVFPQELSAWFEARFKGTSENIHDYTVYLSEGEHQAIHQTGKGGAVKGIQEPDLKGWNQEWKDFAAKHPNASPQMIFEEAGRLMDKYKISGEEIARYKRAKMSPPARPTKAAPPAAPSVQRRRKSASTSASPTETAPATAPTVKSAPPAASAPAPTETAPATAPTVKSTPPAASTPAPKETAPATAPTVKSTPPAASTPAPKETASIPAAKPKPPATPAPAPASQKAPPRVQTAKPPSRPPHNRPATRPVKRRLRRRKARRSARRPHPAARPASPRPSASPRLAQVRR